MSDYRVVTSRISKSLPQMITKNSPLIVKTFLPAGWGAAGLFLMATLSHGQTLYSFGNPTGEEQLYIELINRARANPSAEGARLAASTDPDVVTAMSYFSINKTKMQTEFSALAATPPLAPNEKLSTSARGHSLWMFNTATQAHNQSATNTPATRITATGYAWSSISENIYAYSKSTWFGHAGFQVDWGMGGTGGMQAGRGHRMAIHSPVLREIGVGVHPGTNGTVGPQLVTQDFGKQSSNPTFGSGVAYYDLNGNNFYDSNEGISGLTVNIAGATQYCKTAIGGGWVVPVPTTAATRAVTFSGPNVNRTANLSFSGDTNAKLDLKLTYAPPTITSPTTTVAGSPHNLTFTSVAGATAYEWNTWNLATAAAENCNSATSITSSTTGTYSLLNTAVKQEGTGSFKLENSTGSNQSFQLNSLFYGGASPALSFQSSLRYAALAETFRVQVKEEGTSVWSDVDRQTGTNGAGSQAFTPRSATLAGMTGKAFRIRFSLTSSGSYYAFSGNAYGWFIDAINFTGVSTLQSNIKQTLANTSGTFTPGAGSYLIALAPVILGSPYAGAYQTLVAAPATPPKITTQPTSITITSGSTATFTVVAAGTSPTYQWYQGNSGDTTSPVAGATSPRLITPVLTSNMAYWVRAANPAGVAVSNAAVATVTDAFTIWARSLEIANSLPQGTLSNATGDADHDGRSNLVEYAFGTSPLIGNESAPRMPVPQTTATHFIMRYQRDTALLGVQITPQACPVLGDWKAPVTPGAIAGFTDTLISAAGTVQTREAKLPLSSGNNCFMRMQVSQP
jgi:Ig-like domain CHU_C associated/Cysteine-rich secretory protein family